MTEETWPQQVVVKDVEMPFFSMVWFMVKWAVASIPALFILSGAMFVAVTALVSIFGVLGLLGGLGAGSF